jgi:molybdopterin-guanine dinucleotide biosynthesis protein A
MPFVSPALLSYMIELLEVDAYDVIVPRVDGYPEGLHAVYSKNCMPSIRQRLEVNQLKVISFYEDVRVRYLDEPEYRRFDRHGISFKNINTPDELQEAQRLSGATS